MLGRQCAACSLCCAGYAMSAWICRTYGYTLFAPPGRCYDGGHPPGGAQHAPACPLAGWCACLLLPACAPSPHTLAVLQTLRVRLCRLVQVQSAIQHNSWQSRKYDGHHGNDGDIKTDSGQLSESAWQMAGEVQGEPCDRLILANALQWLQCGLEIGLIWSHLETRQG